MRTRSFHFMLRMTLFQFALALIAVPLLAETYIGYSDYQIITDVTFPADRYFRMMQGHGVNFQRIWVTGYSDVAIKFQELMPFVRQGNRYRLSDINPEYRKRLTTVLEQAREHDQRVMLTLFDHWSLRHGFEKTPWFAKNNHERLLKNALPDFYNIRDKKLMRIQEHFVREIVRSTKDFNPIYEIMNESGSATCDVVSVWHKKVASWIQEEAAEADIAVNLKQECTDVLYAGWVDFISFHHNIWGRYGICKAIQKYPEKHVIIDTDGAWEVRDDNRLVKDWLAETQSCGASFNHKDDIYDPDQELLRHYRGLK